MKKTMIAALALMLGLGLELSAQSDKAKPTKAQLAHQTVSMEVKVAPDAQIGTTGHVVQGRNVSTISEAAPLQATKSKALKPTKAELAARMVRREAME